VTELAPEPGEGQGASWHGELPILFEVSWETCNQVGGIYQVLRSRAPAMQRIWGERYVLVGPDHGERSAAEFEESGVPPPFLRPILDDLAADGLKLRFGHWLISGRPQAVLVDHGMTPDDLDAAKYYLWADHSLDTPGGDDLIDTVVGFGNATYRFLWAAARRLKPRPVVAHFHEWMGALAIPRLRREAAPIATVFTTHATVLGRHLANDRGDFSHVLPGLDPAAEAERYRVGPVYRIERACAHGAHVFTTVSDVTARECQYLLGRIPDVVTPNGLNIQRFVAQHMVQQLHAEGKDRIHQFTRSHFFPYYTFDLDSTLYFFTSGRYEPRNKGFDLCLEAMARLNALLKGGDSGVTVVFFVITRRDGVQLANQCLRNRALLGELSDTCAAITAQVGSGLFDHVAAGKTPHLDSLVDEYWALRLRRTMQAWHRSGWPPVVTHYIQDAEHDPVLAQIRNLWMANSPDDPVKVVYHPEFITPANPLWKMEYEQFVRGCHLGVFPSAYEPWGYTPLECLASGVPAVSSDLSGFGQFTAENHPDHENWGAYIVRRAGRSYYEAAAQVAEVLLHFSRSKRRDRIALRNKVDAGAEAFDWSRLVEAYTRAHKLALDLERSERAG
jgi:glycogen(starch) synthase